MTSSELKNLIKTNLQLGDNTKEKKKKAMNHITYLGALQSCLDKTYFQRFSLKAKQIIILEHLFCGRNVVGVLPTGYGKSLLFHMLPFLVPKRNERNIVIVVSPLNSIIADQNEKLNREGIVATFLNTESNDSMTINQLFPGTKGGGDVHKSKTQVPTSILTGKVDVIFAHPVALLNEKGRSILRTDIFQKNVAAFVVDEAHCVNIW